MPHTKLRNSSFFLECRTHPECMAVRMPEVELSDIPGFVRRRPGHDQPMLQRELICRINLGRRRQPPGHPNPARVVVARVLRHRAATRTLGVLAKEYLAFAAAHAPESRRVAPVPAFLPAKLFKPGETL